MPNYNRIEIETEKGLWVNYVDKEGNLVAPFGRYTSVEITVNNEGKVICEKYYFHDQPGTSSMGQNGNLYEYDSSGNQVAIQFIDEEAIPMNGLFGYSTIKKTFYADGGIKDERYYNTEGNPVKLPSGNYGIRHVGGKVYYLDSKGNVIFNLNLFISYNQWIVVVIGLLLCVIIILLHRNLAIGVAICYVEFIFYQTLVRHSETGNLDLELFWSYKQFFTNHSLRVQILNNIWLFIPFGTALYSILRKP